MKILAVDYGDARTGLAICDAGEMLASPVGVIHSHRMDEVVQKAAEAAREQRAERIVVGNPINMNGTRGPRSELCQEFAAKLGEASGLPVVLWDEDVYKRQVFPVLTERSVPGWERSLPCRLPALDA